ncbi:hypothetical protein J437_LFUL005889 [Ladona fulva]|uniref:RNA-directed DNA polymerase n=1 Tax=Ladona fulva TaxID=123851 RepID=A0A8K0K8H5_LADFU|nr:hypothetical protein J437_LFUL005889 [Ladona fulva]
MKENLGYQCLGKNFVKPQWDLLHTIMNTGTAALALGAHTSSNPFMAFGSVPQFSGDANSWEDFIEQLGFYFEAHGTSLDSQKRAILLSCTGVQTYNIVKKLCAPEKPSSKIYSDILLLLARHYVPVTCVWVEREKFDARSQRAGEAFKDFVADLRHLADNCKFDNLEQSLLRQILRGMANLALKEQLFSMKFEDLTLQVAFDRATAAEQARNYVSQMKRVLPPPPPPFSAVNAISNSQFRPNPRQYGRGIQNGVEMNAPRRGNPGPLSSAACFRCGAPEKHDCPLANAVCHYCKKRGHIAKVCMAKRRRGNQNGGQPIHQGQSQRPSQRAFSTHALLETEGDGPDAEHQCGPDAEQQFDQDVEQQFYTTDITHSGMKSLFFFTPSPAAPPPFTVSVNIKGRSIPMEVDSGAGHTVIGSTLYFEKFSQVKLEPCSIRLTTWSNQSLALLGQAKVNVTFCTRSAKLLILVAAHPGPSLLGRSWFQPLCINVSGVNKMSISSVILPVEIKEFSDVFRPGLGKYSGPSVHIHIKPDAKPVFCTSRPVPYALWCLLLSNYNYRIKYRPGSKHSNADFLSRCPLDDDNEAANFPDPAGILLLEEAPADSPLTARNVADATSRDPVLSKVYQGLLNGWDFTENEPGVQSFTKAPPGTFTVLKGCILRGTRVVIPNALRQHVLQMLHKVHQGVVRTKALARSYVWWPKIDEDIENLIKSCLQCGVVQSNPRKAPVIPWSIPTRPWSRLHLDYAGPVRGHTFLICVDSMSRWVEVAPTRGSRLKTLLDKLHPGTVNEQEVQRTRLLMSPSFARPGFSVDDKVFFRAYNSNDLWLPGEVSAVKGPRTYQVLTSNGLGGSPYQYDCFPPVTQGIPTVMLPANPNVEEATPQAHTTDEPTQANTPDRHVAPVERPRRESRPPRYLKDFLCT